MAEAWAGFGSDLAGWASYAGGAILAVAGIGLVARRMAEVAARHMARASVTLPFLTLAFSVQASGVPAGASERRTSIPRRHAATSPRPWLGSERSSSPLPARTGGETSSDGHGALSVEPVDVPGRESEVPTQETHPAIHRRSGGKVTPLFPRVPKKSPDPEVRRRERQEAMRRHPAGKGLQADASSSSAVSGQSQANDEVRAASYRVLEGDTLWSIAERHLGTKDVRRIARYWPRIHRANSGLVDNPNLIQPGWTLVLPPEDQL